MAKTDLKYSCHVFLDSDMSNTPFTFVGNKAVVRSQVDFSNTPVTSDKGRIIPRHQYFEKRYGLVVFLDALGVKGIWRRISPQQIMDRWEKTYYSFYDALYNMPGLDLSAFSDTLIISAAANTDLHNNPKRLIELVVGQLITPFVRSVYYRIFLRGVISMGEYYRSSKMLLGSAVDEAAEYFDTSDWIGLATSPSTSKILDDCGMQNSNCLVRYRVTYKGYLQNSWALNWVSSELHKNPPTKC